MGKPFRDCVVAVICHSDGSLLAGERADQLGAWQLPQGGMDPGESPEQTLLRELKEEIGTNSIRIIQKLSGLIRYDFPPEMREGPAKKYRGQQQVWFMVELNSGAIPDLKLADGEFQNLRWMSANELLEGIVPWKREAYHQGLKAFGLI
ncbi:MAG: RNA pyrophosphohydrolase [Proteobacteria bacterium]|nr:RNA pyrophosphohydrolase [Pseudomonadota bacterium]